MSYETRYAALRRQEADERANSPEAVAARLRDAEARKQAAAEILEPVTSREGATPGEVFAALQRFEARVVELNARSGS